MEQAGCEAREASCEGKVGCHEETAAWEVPRPQPGLPSLPHGEGKANGRHDGILPVIMAVRSGEG